MEKSTLITQTIAAFDFVEKLYTEVSYLIKQLEGNLAEEDEKFVIGRHAGYSVSAHLTTNLDSQSIREWLLKSFAVFFAEKEKTRTERGKTITKITPDLRILYFRFMLHEKDLKEPVIYAGYLYDIKPTALGSWIKQFEHIPGNIIEINDEKIFKTPQRVNYENSRVKFKGKFIEVPLFDINNAEAISTKLIKPALKLYRS